MQCLIDLIGLRGACDLVASDAGQYTDPHITKRQLSEWVTQADYPNGVGEFFDAIRKQAATEVAAGVHAAFQGRYLSRTVTQLATVGKTGDTLTAIPAAALLRGVKLFRQCDKPNVGFRITRLGFIGQFTGNVVVSYVDAVTGQTVGTQTIAATAGVPSFIYVNDFLRGRAFNVVYNATAVASYKTTTGYEVACYTCPDKWAVNGLCSAQAIQAPIGQPTNVTVVNNMGGLIVDVAMECDTESWLCAIRHQLVMPMLWKVCELATGYGATSSGRSNTSTVRDRDLLKEQQMMFNDRFKDAFATALKQAKVPDDPTCFVCERKSRIAVAIP